MLYRSEKDSGVGRRLRMSNNDFVCQDCHLSFCHFVIFKILILINKQKQGSMGGALLFVLSCIEQEDACSIFA